MLTYVTPRWGDQPRPPYTKICDIFGNYERISTKISVISLLARRLVFGEKLKYVTPSWEHTTLYSKILEP